MKNYNGKEVKLMCVYTGIEKKLGDPVVNFRGEESVISSMRPPHKSSASGYVNNFYAGVYDLEYVEV